jgi:hypothetical protein
MRTIQYGLWSLGSAGVVALLASGCGSTCGSTDSCGTFVPPGGSGGANANGGGGASGTGSPGGASAGGSAGSAGSSSAGAAGESGAAGAGGAPPCDGTCSGTTPVCDTDTNACVECVSKSDCQDAAKPACDSSTNTCVQCTGDTDCTNAATPLCDLTTQQCVACLQQSDCKTAAASACNAGACTACTADAECSNIAGKGVCDAGICVQCTVPKESVCSGKSCNPATNACTTTAVGSVTSCQPCLADSECVGGNQADPDARCVPMTFMGAARPDGFCLRRVSKGCARPYQISISATSLSGAASEAYCGIDQDSTRCEAVLDLVAGNVCSDGQDTSCGCTRDSGGACVAAGQGGLCRTVGVNAKQCTYPCGTTPQCPTGTTCGGSSTTYCQ